MPFKSEKQRRWMHINKPSIAKAWEKEYKKGGHVFKAQGAEELMPLNIILNLLNHLLDIQSIIKLQVS